MNIEHVAARPARRQKDRRRPSWVWLIASYYISAGLWSLAIYWQLYTGKLTLLPPSNLPYFANLAGADYWPLMALSGLGVCAAVLLLLLRRVSLYLFALHFALGVGFAVWNALARGALDTSRPGMILAGLALWSASAAVCFYVWHLAQKGVLK